MLRRRDFTIACALGLAARGVLAQGEKVMGKINYGAQLYTARDLMAEDAPGTLRAIAGLGYSEFEFAGYFGEKPEDLRRLLDNLGATAPSAHWGPDVFAGELTEALDQASVLGHRYLVLPWWDPPQRTQAGYQRLAELLNRSAEKAAPYGIRVAYHNHDLSSRRWTAWFPSICCSRRPSQIAWGSSWIVTGGH